MRPPLKDNCGELLTEYYMYQVMLGIWVLFLVCLF